MKIRKFNKLAFSDRTLLGIGYILLAIFVGIIVVPLLYVVVASFMDPTVLQNEGIRFDFSTWTLTAYKRVMTNKMIWVGFINSTIYSLAYTIISVLVTIMAAYPMSKKDFVGKGFFNSIFIITMFFGGGLIPTYLVIGNLQLINTPLAVILPGAFSVWNMILARTYYQSIPEELREASSVDGASELVHFIKVLLPVCKPIVAVLALYQFVGMWNSYFDAMIYLNDSGLQPLQLVLRSILIQNTPETGMIADIQSTAELAKLAELLKYSTIVVSSLPLLIMYPFFQKYFDSGIMIGSVKG
ncbi:carbohydrate ABC transporter permease [Lacrimispora algidixylanolytica]|uniref:Sugar ABC transporter permease n=1 Tax=Lacrimispora algidixylanolytica TaxID=94868 RepID=A0A419T6L3_9FIRM|nr:carbohydrate ABC transporter permease [Lacrimispora algidixylanolytica]RKD33121.1 sugar ABC transporter permease [Lacrimispora algidixylanolytica]